MIRRLQCFCILSIVGGLAWAASAADTPAPAASSSAHQEVGTPVPFDLERGRVTAPLPFDVMFYLQAKVPETTKQGKAKVGTATVTPTGTTCVPKDDLAAAIVKITEGTKKEPYLEVTVDPALEAQKRYCFRFEILRERTPEEAAQIVPRIVTELARLYAETDMEHAAIRGQQFRENLYRAVASGIAPAKVVLPPGSFLTAPKEEADKAAKAEETWSEVVSAPPLTTRMLLARPFELRSQVEDALENYRTRRDEIPDIDGDALEKTATLAEVEAEIEKLVAERERLEAEKKPKKKEDAERREEALLNLETAVDNLRIAAEALQQQEASLRKVAEDIELLLTEQYDVAGTTNADFATRFNWYVSADLGMGAAPETDDFFSYLGANIYTRPVNKKAPLAGRDFRKRFAFLVGFSEKITSNDREGLIGGRPLLLGGGIRITDHIRLGLGAQIFREDDPDPLVTKKSLAATPFVSASIDMDVVGAFQSIFSPLFK